MTITRRHFIKQGVGATLATSLLPYLPTAKAAAPSSQLATLAAVALDKARSLGASYADIRINRYHRQALSARDPQAVSTQDEESYGFGVRVLVDGCWGFAASPKVEKDEIARMSAQAVAIARANKVLQDKPIVLVSEPAYVDVWQTPIIKDPFKIPFKQKTELLLEINRQAVAKRQDPYQIYCTSQMFFVKEEKFFANTDGSLIEQTIVRNWPTFTVTAVDTKTGKFQTRDSLTQPMGMGYEYLAEYPLVAEAQQAAEEAMAKHKAKPVTPGKKDLVLAPSNLWLTIHESVGHSTELDRALGYEANYAGTSFATLDKLGKLQFAAPIVNFIGDKTQPRALNTCGYDDDGVKTKQWHIVKDGIFVDYQTTRDQAHLLGRKESHGTSYAESWSHVPFQRMPNVSLLPAESRNPISIDDLIAGVDDGVLIFGRGGYSIDQQRYNFQFSGQLFYEIKGGKRGEMLRNVAYQANTVEFWNACDGIGTREHYELGGSFFDGKGEPSQSNAVSHGCAPARFRRINIINIGKEI
ncbi:MAG: TldD/PmbA family protein [Acidobacteriota bacterium]